MSTATGTDFDPYADDATIDDILGDDDTGGKKQSRGARASAAVGSRIGRILIIAIAVLWTIPTFGVFVSSFRPENDVKTNGWWNFFRSPAVTLDNYKSVLSSSSGGDNLGKFFMNSVIITIPAVALSIGLALLAAYAFSWIEFKGRDWMFVATVALLMVPLQMSLVPILQLFSGGAHIGSVTIFPDLNLTGTFVGVWIAHTIFGMPFCIFILKNFVGALPRDIIEAAKIDGAGHLTIFLRLIVPLSVPAIASLTIFQFMWIWNDYLIALIFAGQDKAPITRQLATLTGTRGQSWHLLTAAGMVAMVVPIAVFFALQRYFVRGMLAGAVKG
jgi:alpha-glucoside transport system permease protein